ncbi:MAG: hypothetical protein FWF09_01055, partial [Bacteroidales bacterium]|nr:hypothetical protein [Bacteroidales bacterium]
MWGVRGITFIGCSFDNTITTGSNQGGAGIYTLDAGFKVINYCDPSGAIQGIDCACLAQYNTPATFSNQTYGIFSSSTGTPRTIYIDQAEFHS